MKKLERQLPFAGSGHVVLADHLKELSARFGDGPIWDVRLIPGQQTGSR